jgi:dienelactone hydrolase
MTWQHLINSRLLALVCILFLVFVLTACGGGGGGPGGGRSPEPIADTCDATSTLVDGVCQPFAVRLDERATTPFVEDGTAVSLEVVLFKPLTGVRFPTVVFHHGSTGNGSDPALFGLTFTSKAITQYFVERGWMVAFPQRRGRGRSDGLYDEGFQPDRSAYSCRAVLTLVGAERALDDLDAITEWLRMRADVDTTRMLVGGTSRGGILSVAHVARRPDVYLGAINFVGGWLGEGCGDYREVNRKLFVDGAGFPGPTLWLYGENDSFYSVPYSRTNFDAYMVAGGLGAFHALTRATGLDGHFIINDPPLWEATMDDFIDRL